MLETQLYPKFLAILNNHGYFYKASDRYKAGILDIIGCYQGIFVSIELKVDDNILTPLQNHTVGQIRAAQGRVFTVKYKNKTKKYYSAGFEFGSVEELCEWILKLSLSPTK